MSNKKTGTDGRLNPGLKARHMTMIALGGSIGTGLFLASGGAIASAGPGGALLAYAAVGIMVYFLMTSLGELATYLPDSGSFETYASRFVDPSLGFAMGWNFWYNWAITIAAELSAATLIIKYWFPNSPSLLWSVLFLALILGLNILSVKGYGESEYWFATIKIAVVIIFLVVGVLMIFGIMGGEAVGFSNFTIGDGRSTADFSPSSASLWPPASPSKARRWSAWPPGKATTRASMYRGRSGRSLADSAFYILAILVIGLLIPYTNPNLLKSGLESIGVSPFTLVFEKAGLAFAASVMNAVILSSVLSAGNSGMYASSRVLYSLALRGKAPKFLGKLNRRGIPVNALLLTTLVGMLAFLASLFGDGVVYNWLLNASGMCGFITWLGIAISHYRFRRAYMAQGRDLNDLPYKARWFPFGPIFAFILCFIVILGQNLSAFSGETIDWYGVIVSYISVPLFLLVWLGYKWTKKSKLIPLDKCDLEVPDQR